MRMKNWKRILVWVLIILIGFAISFSGIQFPPWVSSVAAGALGAWIALTFWQSGIEQLDKPSKEYREKLLRGKPLEVKHAIPRLQQDGWGIDDSLRQFFHDFDWFGVIANDWGPIKEGPWRLQESENTELDTLSYDSPHYGRQYHIFYNAERVGLLEITDYLKYTFANPRITAKIGIGDARLFTFHEVRGFLTSIAALVSGTKEEYEESQRKIDMALLQAHWDAARGELIGGSSDLEVEVYLTDTSAAHYLEMREQRRQKSSTTA